MKFLRILILVELFFIFSIETEAQSYAFGLKGGPTAAYQLWNDRTRGNSLLFRYHIAAYIESEDNDDDRYAVFSSIGYHIKGSAVRFRGGVDLNNIAIPARTSALEFRNISLILGAKVKNDLAVNQKWYYSLGLRGDYTLDYALDLYTGFGAGVRRWNFGLNVGGGIQWNLSDYVGVIAELNLQPDFSRQIYIPPLQNFPDPFNGVLRTLPEQNIRNVALELSFGFRLLRKIEYVDEYW